MTVDDNSKVVVKLFQSGLWAEGGEYKAPDTPEIEVKGDTKLRSGGTAPELGGQAEQGDPEETIGKSYENIKEAIELSTDAVCAKHEALKSYRFWVVSTHKWHSF